MPLRNFPEHRILLELVEADIEIGFRLVDMLESGPAGWGPLYIGIVAAV